LYDILSKPVSASSSYAQSVHSKRRFSFYRLDYRINRVRSLIYPSTADNDQETRREQEKKAARAVGVMYFGVFVPFLRRALVEGVYGGKVEDLDAESEGKVAAVLKRWEDWVQEEHEQGK